MIRRLRLWAFAAACFCVSQPGSSQAATELGATRLGLPGLSETIVAPAGGSAPLRFGLYYEQATVDPSHGFEFSDDLFGSKIQVRQLRLGLSVYASPYVIVGVSVPLRSWSADGVLVDDGAGGVALVGDGSESGIGDVEASATGRFAQLGRLTLGGWAMMRLPTGDESLGLSVGHVEGEFGLHGTAAFLGDGVLPETRWTNNIGWRFNKRERIGFGILDSDPAATPSSSGVWSPAYPALSQGKGESFNDALLLRTAVEMRRRWGHLFLELSTDWLVNYSPASFRESPSWFTPGVYLGKDDGLSLKASWSIGLFADDADTAFEPTYPDWFISAGLSYPVFLGGRDSDGDGVPDKEDKCPETPEDVDGYQDEDGCPDRDNDGDGIPDRRDLAPNMPEDFDNFEDEDGRPDLDNDLDGIADSVDRCPNRAEDFDGFEDEDGCPDVFEDLDGDGIEDAKDRCPDAPEDFDGFEDEDGCPDPDNDLDGILDVEDGCPNEKEVFNGTDDGDGCPD